MLPKSREKMSEQRQMRSCERVLRLLTRIAALRRTAKPRHENQWCCPKSVDDADQSLRRLNSASGIWRIMSMIQRQNHGR